MSLAPSRLIVRCGAPADPAQPIEAVMIAHGYQHVAILDAADALDAGLKLIQFAQERIRAIAAAAKP